MAKTPVIAISLGGSKTSIACFDSADQLVERAKPFASEQRDKTLANLDPIIRRFTAGLRDWSLGIAVGAPVEPATGIVGEAPGLPSWTGFDIVAHFRAAYGLAEKMVFARNDAQAGALAEHRYGAGQGERNMVFLTCGNGMGGGVIANGRLVEGEQFCAGEVGRIPITSASRKFQKDVNLEGCMSGMGFNTLHQLMGSPLQGKAGDSEKDFAKKVFEIARGQQPSADRQQAQNIIELAAAGLGEGIAVIASVLNPKLVVIGGIYARQHAVIDTYMWPAIRRFGHPRAIEHLQVRPAKLCQPLPDDKEKIEVIDYFQALAVARYGQDE